MASSLPDATSACPVVVLKASGDVAVPHHAFGFAAPDVPAGLCRDCSVPRLSAESNVCAAASGVIWDDQLHCMLSQMRHGYRGIDCRALVREQTAHADVQSPLADLAMPAGEDTLL